MSLNLNSDDMETLKSPISIRIIFWLANIMAAMMGAVVLLAFVANILAYTGFFDDDFQMTAFLPGAIEFVDEGVLETAKGRVPIELVEANASIRFVETPSFISRKLLPIMFFMAVVCFYLIWLFRRFMLNVKKGQIFIAGNITLLKNLAYSLAGFWLICVLYMQLFYYLVTNNLRFEELNIAKDIPHFGGLLMAALLIWVLAHIFGTGLKLQEEKDLTI